MSEQEDKTLKALKILEFCPLCGARLSTIELSSNKDVMVLYCNDKKCCSDHKARTDYIRKFTCHVDTVLNKIILYYVDVKIGNKEYCICATNNMNYKTIFNKKTEIYEWVFNECDIFDDSSFKDNIFSNIRDNVYIDFYLNEEPIFIINDYYVEPDGTKEFYENLVRRLLNIKAFL
jgi:hypothetical protein